MQRRMGRTDVGVMHPNLNLTLWAQESIDTCPVECIHWVTRDQLPALEYVMQRRMGRTDVGVMMSGCGAGRGGDVFAEAARFVKERERRWAPGWSTARPACLHWQTAAVA